MLLGGACSFVRMLQHDNPVLAAGYFLEAADIHLVQDKFRGAALCVKDALRMYCRYRQRLIVVCVCVCVLDMLLLLCVYQHGQSDRDCSES